LDTTDTNSILNTNADVAILTPVSTPGVFNEIILLAVFRTVTNSEHCMIKVPATAFLSNNTTSVVMESRLVGLNSDRDRLKSDGSLKLNRVLLRHIGETSCTNHSLGFIIAAFTTSSSVEVVILLN